MAMKLTLEQVKAKSAVKIATLQEPLRTAATLLVERVYRRGIMIVITEALRTYQYQNELYAKGRTTKQLRDIGITGIDGRPSLKVVTNARGGYSNHNFGYAFDFALLLPNGVTVSWDTMRDDNLSSLPDWDEVVQEAKAMGLEWGGDWRSFRDLPHLQMVFGLNTAQYRAGQRPSAAQVKSALAKMKPVVVVAPTPIPVVKEPVAIAYKFVTADTERGLAFVYDKVSYVLMRELANCLGVPFYWDNDEKRAYFNATQEQAESGAKKPLQDTKLIDGRVYVQLRAIAEAYGKTVLWDGKNKTVGVAA